VKRLVLLLVVFWAGCGGGGGPVATTSVVITTASPVPDAVQGKAYTFQLTASGGLPPYTWTASGLPDGLQISKDGKISGMPTNQGTVKFQATVSASAPWTN
jgi:hypothetical protein